jgi:hypothetical protein
VLLKWLLAGLLVWGVFTGLAFALAPLLVSGKGNLVSSLAGVVLVLFCCFGLLKLPLGRRTDDDPTG